MCVHAYYFVGRVNKEMYHQEKSENSSPVYHTRLICLLATWLCDATLSPPRPTLKILEAATLRLKTEIAHA